MVVGWGLRELVKSGELDIDHILKLTQVYIGITSRSNITLFATLTSRHIIFTLHADGTFLVAAQILVESKNMVATDPGVDQDSSTQASSILTVT